MKSNDWLQELKPGDKVIVSVGGIGNDSIDTVRRLTKTQIILGLAEVRFRRKDGKQIGGASSWNWVMLREYKEAAAQKIKHRNLSERVVARTTSDKTMQMDYASLLEIERLLLPRNDR